LSLGVFIIVLLLFRYVSLGSIAAGISFPLWIIFFPGTNYLSLKLFSVVAALLLLFTHRKNIKRLLKGEEKKADFLFREKE